MNVKKVSLTLGAFVGLVHLVWSIMIGMGWAQGYLDFVLGMHSLSNPYTVAPFSLGKAVLLIILASIVGCIVGAVFASIFNKINK